MPEKNKQLKVRSELPSKIISGVAFIAVTFIGFKIGSMIRPEIHPSHVENIEHFKFVIGALITFPIGLTIARIINRRRGR